MKLVYDNNLMEVTVGDEVTLENGEKVGVMYFREPHKPASEGKVTIEFDEGVTREYYVSIIGAKWIEREDRGYVAEKKTITISDWRGDDKEVDKEQFVSEWVSHGKQFANLNYEFYLSIKDQIETVAAAEFDVCLKRQNHKRESESKERRDGKV